MTESILTAINNNKMPEIDEIWKDIVGYEGLYQVSSMGRIRSCRRTCNHPNGKKRERVVQEKIVATHGHASLWIGLYRNGRRQKYFVQDLVAAAFLENYEMGATVSFIDGNKKNNRIENLSLDNQLKPKVLNAIKTLVLVGAVKKDALRIKNFKALQAYFSTSANSA